MKTIITSSIAVFAATILASTVLADESKEPVNVSNFVRAESDHMIRSNMKGFNLRFDKFYSPAGTHDGGQPTDDPHEPGHALLLDYLRSLEAREDHSA
jgi:mevalonate pyrophosphate decarboxylase